MEFPHAIKNFVEYRWETRETEIVHWERYTLTGLMDSIPSATKSKKRNCKETKWEFRYQRIVYRAIFTHIVTQYSR